jgi:hypothetical protein
MDRSYRHGIVEEVVEQFGDAADGAVADEGEAQDQLAEPGLGDGQPEEQLRRISRRRGEGVVEGVVGVVQLLVDELAADVLLVGRCGDRLAGQGIEGQLLACRRGQQPRRGGRGWDGDGRWR